MNVFDFRGGFPPFLLMVIRSFLIIIFCAASFSHSFAQGGGFEQMIPADSTFDRIRSQYDSVRRLDSVRRVELLQEIEHLKKSSGAEANRLLRYLKQQQASDSIAELHKQKIMISMLQRETGAPVVPFRDTLFYIYLRVGSFTPAHRASAIAHRIELLYSDPTFNADSLTIISSERSADIIYSDEVIMSVNELEALRQNTSMEALANQYRSIIIKAIKDQQEATSVRQILLRIAGLILILTGIFLLIRIINRMFRRLQRRLINSKQKLAKGVRIGNYQFLDVKRLTKVLLFLSNVLRLVITVVAVYVTLPLMFLLFPWTEGIADTLLGWILTPLRLMYFGFVGYLPDLFTVIVILVTTYYILKLMKFIASEIESGALIIPGFYADWAKPTLNIVRILITAFAFIVIFPYLPGSDSPIFQGVSVFLGLLLSLGSSSAISNAVAGLVITYMRPFRIGDRVKIGEISGDVIEKTLLVTRIRTIKNEEITVPNSAILSGHTINYTTAANSSGLILHTSVTIGYSVPWKQVHELLLEAARATPAVMEDHAHRSFVLQTSLQDFYIEYQLNVFTGESHSIASIYSNLHQNIQDKFAAAGVEIMSPHFRAVRDGNAAEMPPGSKKS